MPSVTSFPPKMPSVTSFPPLFSAGRLIFPQNCRRSYVISPQTYSRSPHFFPKLPSVTSFFPPKIAVCRTRPLLRGTLVNRDLRDTQEPKICFPDFHLQYLVLLLRTSSAIQRPPSHLSPSSSHRTPTRCCPNPSPCSPGAPLPRWTERYPSASRTSRRSCKEEEKEEDRKKNTNI